MRFSFLLSLAGVTFALGLMSPMTASAADAPTPAKAYPLTTCVVSGEKLGTMGKPFVHSVEGREVQFCCKSCLKEFNKDTKKFLKKLDDASKPKA